MYNFALKYSKIISIWDMYDVFGDCIQACVNGIKQLLCYYTMHCILSTNR